MKQLRVTQSSLRQRLRRRLVREGKGRHLRRQDGTQFIVSEEGARQIELEKFSRHIGVLKPWEKLL